MKTRSYLDFTLDLDKISNRSTKAGKICLPYSGKLPEGIKSAEVCFNLTMQLDCKVVLLLTDVEGKTHNRPCEATAAEIKTVLDRFFEITKSGRPKDSGLDEYWLGVNIGLYTAWAQSFGLRGLDMDYNRKMILRLTDVTIDKKGKTA